MDDFIHNLRMGKNRPYDRKRRHYDNSKFKGNAPPSSRGKKGPSGRNIGPENLGQVKKTLDEIIANQKRLIEIAEKTAASAEREADALEIIAATITRLGAQGQADTQVIAEIAEKNVPLTPSPPPITKKKAPPTPDRAIVQEKIRAMRGDGASYESIARHLNAEGIPTLSGRGKWRGQAVQRLYQQGDEAQSS